MKRAATKRKAAPKNLRQVLAMVAELAGAMAKVSTDQRLVRPLQSIADTLAELAPVTPELRLRVMATKPARRAA